MIWYATGRNVTLEQLKFIDNVCQIFEDLVYDDFICYINKRDRTQVLPTYEVFSHLYNKFT
jgi:hypothetical protein